MTYSELVALADLHEVALDEHKLRWAKIVAAAEREACAKVCDRLAQKSQTLRAAAYASAAEAIRERG